MSTIGFVVGALGVGGGLALLFTAPSDADASATAAGVAPYIGLGQVGATGRF